MFSDEGWAEGDSVVDHLLLHDLPVSIVREARFISAWLRSRNFKRLRSPRSLRRRTDHKASSLFQQAQKTNQGVMCADLNLLVERSLWPSYLLGMYRGVDGRARVDAMGSQGCVHWFQSIVSNRASLRVSASLSVSS
jgi:hypothetical protein